MSCHPKTSLTVLALLCTCFAIAQKPVVYYFSEVGLTLYIPASFKVLDAAKNDALNQKGLKAVEEANHVKYDVSQTKTLIAAKKNEYDYFNITLTPFDPKKDGSFAAANQQVSNILYHTFKDKLPAAKIDSTTTQKDLGGLTFTEFRIKIVINEKATINTILLSRYYKGYDMGISYLYLDNVTKGELETTLASFRFAK